MKKILTKPEHFLDYWNQVITVFDNRTTLLLMEGKVVGITKFEIHVEGSKGEVKGKLIKFPLANPQIVFSYALL